MQRLILASDGYTGELAAAIVLAEARNRHIFELTVALPPGKLSSLG